MVITWNIRSFECLQCVIVYAFMCARVLVLRIPIRVLFFVLGSQPLYDAYDE